MMTWALEVCQCLQSAILNWEVSSEHFADEKTTSLTKMAGWYPQGKEAVVSLGELKQPEQISNDITSRRVSPSEEVDNVVLSIHQIHSLPPDSVAHPLFFLTL